VRYATIGVIQLNLGPIAAHYASSKTLIRMFGGIMKNGKIYKYVV
jgi:hypothetical protein